MKQLVQNFNNLIKKTIFKVRNKTNSNFQISNFNKYLTTFISLLFFYLFYLSIPALYDKIWVQNNIEKQLLKEFKIDFSISSDISYRILPAPHFLIKDSKIFKKDGNKKASLVDIKNLKVFIGQGNFFNKEKTILKHIKINNANFSISRKDFKLLKDSSKNKFSNKRIEINNSNVFFKNHLDEPITIIKITNASFFSDDESLLNLFNLNGETFNIPFSFNYKKKFNTLNNYEINIVAKMLKLNIFDTYNDEKNNFKGRNNVSSFLNTRVNTNYKIEDGTLTFNSKNSIIKTTKVDYNGQLLTNPFNLNLNINIDNFKLFKILKSNSVLSEIMKTELLFNDKLSVHTSITTNSNLKNEIFHKSKINFNITKGKINFNKTKLVNKKIGSLKLDNSNLFFKEDVLILNTDIIFDINNSDELFSYLQTNKKFRKPIKNILVNLDYNFLTDEIEYNKFKIDNKKVNDESLRILQVFNGNKLSNWNKNKRLLNALFKVYEG